LTGLCLLLLPLPPGAGAAAVTQASASGESLLAVQYDLEADLPIRRFCDLLTRISGTGISLESPRSGGPAWNPTVHISAESARFDEILDSVCARLGSFEWTLHVSDRGAGVVLHPADPHQTLLGARLDCSSLTDVSVETLLSAADTSGHLRFGDPYGDRSMNLQLRAHGGRGSYRPIGDVLRGHGVDLSSLGQTDVRHALAGLLLALPVDQVIFDTKWARDVSQFDVSEFDDQDELIAAIRRSDLAGLEWDIQLVNIRQPLPPEVFLDVAQEPASPPITLDLRNIVYPRAVDLAGEATD
jgi:hypothetical protein